jgi:hypothetical protein
VFAGYFRMNRKCLDQGKHSVSDCFRPIRDSFLSPVRLGASASVTHAEGVSDSVQSASVLMTEGLYQRVRSEGAG